MTTLELLRTDWSWHPSVIAGCIGLLVAHGLAARRATVWQKASYVAGVGLIFLALVSPLDELGDDYLFSAHMMQHLLLVLFAPPLLLLGVPEMVVRRMLRPAWTRKLESVLGRPLVAWILGIGTLWIWHLPALYNATLTSEAVHILEHLSFLVTGVIFWWPVVRKEAARFLDPFRGLVYLFTGAFANTVLGVLLTFAPLGFYPAYMHPDDGLGALPLIRDQWGLTAAADLQLGGLVMWVVGGVVFLTAMMAVIARWYREVDEDTADSPAGREGLVRQ